MKRYKYMFAAAFALVLAACTDDELVDKGIPVETGDEIMFGSTLDGDQNVNVVGQNRIETRTSYGDRTTTGIPVYWKPDDQIAIFCPQASAPANHLVNYKVTPNKDNPSASSTVVKVNPDDVGLQWGAANEHKFFGIYPASIVKATDPDDQGGTITASLPTLQQPVGWRILKQSTPEGEIRTVYFAEPNMDYAFMVAYSNVLKSEMTTSKAISLDFKNLVTVLDITIPGPETGTVTVTNVNVDVVQGQNVDICGDFTIQVDKLDENIIKCTSIPNDKVTDRISIPCYQADTHEFVTLGPNDVLNVKAFIIPDTQNPGSFRQFRITVASLNGSANRITLNKAELGQSVEQAIVPHKINRILLSRVKNGEPANWMGNLDPNIYLTELSIPGSKMSYATQGVAKEYYQTKTIEEQFKDGVRAFIVQTGATCKYKVENHIGIGSDVYTFQDCTDMKEQYTGQDLSKTLESLKKALEAVKKDPVTEKAKECKECAVLVLTFAGAEKIEGIYDADWGVGPFDAGAERAWIESVENYIPKMVQAGYPIYTDPITPETTLGDVAGKIIIKVNYNNTNQEPYVDTETPALFAVWQKPVPGNLAPTSDLYWGKIQGNNSAKMYWLCQEATHVGDGQEITVENKKLAIQQLFDTALTQYEKNSSHNEWFMNDLGGIYTSNNSTTRLAKDMNALAVEKLQARTENASTGLVFMNFADRGVKQSDGSYTGSGADCKSDYLLATIIDNNFKFALRKKGGSTPAAR